MANSDEAKETPPAKLKISGAGFWGNRELIKLRRMLDDNAGQRVTFDANYLEDTALIIISKLHREGYLHPELNLQLTLQDGSTRTFTWDEESQLQLPRPLAARRARFKIHRGVRYYFKRIEFTGLVSVPETQALRYFVGVDFLFRQKSTRVYTPARLDQGIESLLTALNQAGYEQAKVTPEKVGLDDRKGAVAVRLKVEEGPPVLVRSVRSEVFHPTNTEPHKVSTELLNAPYSRQWQQDYAQRFQQEAFHEGYPDAKVEMTIIRREPVGDTIQLDQLLTLKTGPRVKLGEIHFEGNDRTKDWLMKRRTRLQSGEWLDRVQAERGRFRLARLGIFDSVDLNYDETSPESRDVTYAVEEGKILDVSLLAGYGSYELARGGFEIERRNLFGLAQRARLRAVQSFKSTSANFLYTAPELVGRDIDLFLNGSYLDREEISFDRLEYSGSVGAQRYFDSVKSDVALRYTYEILDAGDAPTDSVAAEKEATVSALALNFKHDRRDNPLYPRSGYNVSLNVETASPVLGGEADYTSIEASSSWHGDLGGGRYLHLGIHHAVVMSHSSASNSLPFNKRFFPGGENSVRGYQFGEASPRDAAGELIGAETFLLGNLELEQALTPSWSLVVFADAIGFAADIANYPFDEELVSVGGGIRWKTVVGPVRLEYGHNLNPRAGDPNGTLHFSIGFPF